MWSYNNCFWRLGEACAARTEEETAVCKQIALVSQCQVLWLTNSLAMLRSRLAAGVCRQTANFIPVALPQVVWLGRRALLQNKVLPILSPARVGS